MTESVERLVDRLREQGVRSVEFFEQIKDNEWDLTVYSEGASWKIREVLMHFLTSEKGVSRLIELVVQGEPGVPEDFDLDAYNERKVAQLEGTDPHDLLARFSQARAATITLVEGFTGADLERVGRHPYLGQARVEEMIQMMYRHNQIHQRDIRRRILSETE